MNLVRQSSAFRFILLVAATLCATLSVAGEQTTFTIKASAGKGGTISPTGDVIVNQGSDQAFTITPDIGFDITKVLANKVDQGPVTSYTFVNVQAKGTIKASFKIQSFPLTLTATNGVKISPAGSKIYKYGKQANIKVTPPKGSTAVPILTVDGTPVPLVAAGSKYTYSLIVTQAHVLEATIIQGFTLTAAKAGTGTGTVTSAPAGIACGATCAAGFSAGTMVTLTAAPDSGSSFAGWSGGGCSGTGTCVVTLNADMTVTATFNTVAAGQKTLTVQKAGNGAGTVTSAPAGVNCGATCSSLFDDATVVTLTATPTSGSTFTGWSGGGCSGTGTCEVTLNSDTTVTATFTLMTHQLNVSKAGSGSGTVTSSPAGVNCGGTCGAAFNHGTVVTLTASPSGGSAFVGWSGGGCSGTGTCQVTLNANTTVTATFDTATTQHTLTVSKAGTGAGSVSSSPAGINCGGTCSAPFNDAAVVTLTASPSGGSTFAGWSGGGCSGTGTCQVTLNADTTVTATFSTSGGGSNLMVNVLNNCDDAAVGAIVAVHNANGSVNTKFTVGATGLVDLHAFPSPVTFTVGWPNSALVPNAEIQSFVDVATNIGTFVVTVEGGVCPPVDNLLGSVTVNLNPAPTLLGSVQPIGQWHPATPHTFSVYESDRGSDGKLTLLGDTGSDTPAPNPVKYGFLLDQTFSNGATYNIDVNNNASTLNFSAGDNIKEIAIGTTRKGQSFVIGRSHLAAPAMSGTTTLFGTFPATTYEMVATAPFLVDPTFGFPYSSSNWVRIQNAAPASITIPALFHFPDLDYDGTVTATWTVSSNTAGKVAVVGFSNTDDNTFDDRHWSITLDPTTHSSWILTSLALPTELDISGRTTGSPSLVGYDASFSHSYSDGLKYLHTGGLAAPSPPYEFVFTSRSIPPAP